MNHQRTRFGTAGAIALLLTLPSPLGAQVIDLRGLLPDTGPELEVLPEPQEIIDRHLEVTGGRAAYERIRNTRFVGTLRQGEQSAPQDLVIQRSAPNRQHVQVGPAGGGMQFVTDGTESWTYDGDMVVLSSGDQRSQELRRAALHPFLDWSRYYVLAKTMGVENVGGKPALVVRLMAEDCHQVRLYFDRETGRHVRTVEDIAYAGETIRTDATVSVYRAFGGVAIPTRSHRVLNIRGTRIVQEYEYERVEHNVEMPESLFAYPLAGPDEETP